MSYAKTALNQCLLLCQLVFQVTVDFKGPSNSLKGQLRFPPESSVLLFLKFTPLQEKLHLLVLGTCSVKMLDRRHNTTLPNMNETLPPTAPKVSLTISVKPDARFNFGLRLASFCACARACVCVRVCTCACVCLFVSAVRTS